MNETTLNIICILLISSWGGIASFIHNYPKKSNGNILLNLIKKLMISTFAGAMAGTICIENKYSTAMTLLYCGLAGNMGELVLKYFSNRYFPPK